MDKAKRKRIEAKGWKVGTTSELLGLSLEEARYIELKLALSEHLRKRRVRRKLTQEQLAKLLSSSQSRVAKMESGDPSVSLDLLIRSLLALGTSERDLAKVIASSGGMAT
jgi:DNA-binding XRE family transcriptional regulator